MPFCSNCGQQIQEGAKFCANCGKAVTGESTTSQRKTVYEGELHKCPNCGELLEAFTTKCPSCGYELRGAKNSSSVREFAAKLEAIEAGREQRKSNPIKNLFFGQSLTKTDEQKISLIRSFAIPNTKEDLYEFLILSVSNIDVDSYENDNQLINDTRKAVSDAWKAKFEQAYQKAKLMFADDPKFTEIEKLHSNTNASINKAKWKTWKLAGIIWGILIVVLVIMFTLTFTLTSSAEKKEIQRLENIEIKIEAALEDGDYKLALMNADSLDFNGADSGLERDWEIKRNYWIDKVIEEASKNGVTLERPVDKAEDSENSTNSDNASNDLNNQISSNADKNTYEKSKQEMQDNIDEFNQQMEDVKEQWNEIWNSGSSETNETDSSVGFVEGTFESVSVKGFSFDIPNYWSEEGSKNEYLQYYAEKGDKVVMLSIAYPEESDDDYDVSFDGLYTDNENMIKAVGAMFTDGDVYDHEVFESENGVKGILYRFTYNQKIDWLTKVDGSGYCFCFPSEDDRRWFYVVLLYTNNVASDDYRDDYMTLISTIRKKSQ